MAWGMGVVLWLVSICETSETALRRVRNSRVVLYAFLLSFSLFLALTQSFSLLSTLVAMENGLWSPVGGALYVKGRDTVSCVGGACIDPSL